MQKRKSHWAKTTRENNYCQEKEVNYRQEKKISPEKEKEKEGAGGKYCKGKNLPGEK